jgi:transcriptional regulator of acetoin/glycerol metabolism
LYYRLQGVTITLPPLRERADRHALVRHLVAQESDEGSPLELDDALLAVLDQQRWPGNIRQLRHLLRTMIALRLSDRLTVQDLPPEYRVGVALQNPVAAPASAPDAPETAPQCPADAGLNPLESAERKALLQELQRHSWNMTSVARQLNISRNTLYRKLQRLNIKQPEKSLFH